MQLSWMCQSISRFSPDRQRSCCTRTNQSSETKAKLISRSTGQLLRILASAHGLTTLHCVALAHFIGVYVRTLVGSWSEVVAAALGGLPWLQQQQQFYSWASAATRLFQGKWLNVRSRGGIGFAILGKDKKAQNLQKNRRIWWKNKYHFL